MEDSNPPSIISSPNVPVQSTSRGIFPQTVQKICLKTKYLQHSRIFSKRKMISMENVQHFLGINMMQLRPSHSRILTRGECAWIKSIPNFFHNSVEVLLNESLHCVWENLITINKSGQHLVVSQLLISIKIYAKQNQTGNLET